MRPTPPRPSPAIVPEPHEDFAPVPTRSLRHDGWTPARQAEFLRQLARIGLVSAAARAVGMSAKSAYALRKREGAESFAAAWGRAVGEGRAQALDCAIDRALNGTLAPIFYRGRHVGERLRFDDRLLLAALRATWGEHAGATRSDALPFEFETGIRRNET